MSTTSVEQSATRKVFWRIVPYCFGLYVISYLVTTLSSNLISSPFKILPRGERGS